MTGRIEPATPRVSGGRSTGLSYGHVQWWAEPESNRRLPPYQRGALPPELSAVDGIWARLDSNQQLLACETSALPLSYSPMGAAPGQGVEPRSPRSERGVLPVRRSRNDDGRGGRRPLRPAPGAEARRSRRRLSAGRRCHSMSRPRGVSACKRCFPCLSPTLRPWIADRPLRTLRRSSSYVEGLWSPMLRYGLEKAHAKANAICIRVIPAR